MIFWLLSSSSFGNKIPIEYVLTKFLDLKKMLEIFSFLIKNKFWTCIFVKECIAKKVMIAHLLFSKDQCAVCASLILCGQKGISKEIRVAHCTTEMQILVTKYFITYLAYRRIVENITYIHRLGAYLVCVLMMFLLIFKADFWSC